MEVRTSKVPQAPCGALTLNAVEQHEMECIGSGGIAPHILISRPTAAKIADASHQNHQHAHVISPMPSSDSSSQGDSEDSDFGTSQNANSEDSVVAESELGEFLMDTFEGLDNLEVNALLTASV